MEGTNTEICWNALLKTEFARIFEIILSCGSLTHLNCELYLVSIASFLVILKDSWALDYRLRQNHQVNHTQLNLSRHASEHKLALILQDPS